MAYVMDGTGTGASYVDVFKKPIQSRLSAQFTAKKAVSRLLVPLSKVDYIWWFETTIHNWIAILVELETSCLVSAHTRVAVRRKLRPRSFPIQRFEQCSEKMNGTADTRPGEQGNVVCCCCD